MSKFRFFFDRSFTWSLIYFSAKFLEILTTGSLEIGMFLLKQSVSIFRATAHALHLTGFFREHSRPQKPRSFWSVTGIATSGPVQRHYGFEWLCKHNRLRPEPITSVRLGSEHAQSDRKSVKYGLAELDLARGRDPRN